MIIREIKDNPELLKTFDWFNDYDNTKSWAKYNCPEMVELLDKGFNEFLIKLKHGINKPLTIIFNLL